MKLMAIDGNSLVNRAFYAVRLLTNQDGLYTNAVFGFLNMLLKLIEEEKPEQRDPPGHPLLRLCSVFLIPPPSDPSP